jgi:ketosteroid isomerase-like protein
MESSTLSRDTAWAMSEENVEAVLSSLDGWNRGDLDAWLGPLHPDIEFRTSGVYPGTQTVYRGPAELRRFWTTFREPWESLQIHIDQAREDGDDVVVLGTFEAHARDGMSVHREVAWIFRFAGDLTFRVDAYGTWKEALEAAGLSE